MLYLIFDFRECCTDVLCDIVCRNCTSVGCACLSRTLVTAAVLFKQNKSKHCVTVIVSYVASVSFLCKSRHFKEANNKILAANEVHIR